MSDLSITLHHYKPNPEKPGYCSFDRIATLQELVDEFDAVLDTIPVDNGEYTVKQGYEWHIPNRDLKLDEPATDGMPGDVQLQVILRHGSSEGMLIDLMLFDLRTSTYTSLTTAKFFISDDYLWQATRAVSEAIYEGLFN